MTLSGLIKEFQSGRMNQEKFRSLLEEFEKNVKAEMSLLEEAKKLLIERE